MTFTDDSGGTSGSLQTVSISGSSVAASSTTSITNAAPNPAMVNQPATISYIVAPNPTNDAFTPSGTVTVSASTGESCVGNAPSGSCQITFASAVTRNITATYSGDSNFLGSASQANSEQVVDFTLSASPASLTISSGHTATYTLTANPLNGFTGTVSVTCSGGPPNSTCSVSPNSMNVPGGNSASAVVTLSAPKNAEHGTFTLTFSGTSGIATRTATAGLTVK